MILLQNWYDWFSFVCLIFRWKDRLLSKVNFDCRWSLPRLFWCLGQRSSCARTTFTIVQVSESDGEVCASLSFLAVLSLMGSSCLTAILAPTVLNKKLHWTIELSNLWVQNSLSEIYYLNIWCISPWFSWVYLVHIPVICISDYGALLTYFVYLGPYIWNTEHWVSESANIFSS